MARIRAGAPVGHARPGLSAGGVVARPTLGRTRRPATAHVLESGDTEYARLWKLVNDNNHGRYDAYQQRTARPIPLVVISPA